jgi:hypothetical protein
LRDYPAKLTKAMLAKRPAARQAREAREACWLKVEKVRLIKIPVD